MTFENQLYRVTWDEAAGIARAQWRAGAVVGIEEARAINADVAGLGRGKVLLLVDLREVASIDRPAREFLSVQDQNHRAVALLTRSPATQMLANFFLRLTRSKVPVKMFTDETDAVAWLQEQA